MWTYLHSPAAGVYAVGHYDPKGKWIPESDHLTIVEAVERIRYLNGGDDLAPAPTTPKPYHPSSFAAAALAVAEDLDGAAEELRVIREKICHCHLPLSPIEYVLHRLEVQSAALRAIARRSWDNDWVHHVEVPPPVPQEALDALDEYPSVDPDLDGPSWDDPSDEPKGGR